MQTRAAEHLCACVRRAGQHFADKHCTQSSQRVPTPGCTCTAAHALLQPLTQSWRSRRHQGPGRIPRRHTPAQKKKKKKRACLGSGWRGPAGYQAQRCTSQPPYSCTAAEASFERCWQVRFAAVQLGDQQQRLAPGQATPTCTVTSVCACRPLKLASNPAARLHKHLAFDTCCCTHLHPRADVQAAVRRRRHILGSPAAGRPAV